MTEPKEATEAVDGRTAVTVLGDGPDALLVASELSAADVAVQLVLTSSLHSIVAAARLAWASHRWAGRPGQSVQAVPRGIALAGQVVALPAALPALPGVVGSIPGPARLRSLARARMRNALAEVVGGGQEERSFEDWVVRRFGRPIHQAVFAPYARARWGRDAVDLAASLARVVHGVEDQRVFEAPLPDCGERWRDTLLGAGVVVHELGESLELGVVDDRVQTLRSADGRSVSAGGALWVACAPDRVARWLGGACPVEARAQATHLWMSDVAAVEVAGLDALGPEELHVVDPEGNVWAAISGGTVPGRQLRVTLEGERGLDRQDLSAIGERALAAVHRAAGVEGGRVERVVGLRAWQPAWTPTSHARLRRVLFAWDKLGIVPVGRAGLFADVDPPLIRDHVHALLEAPGGSSWDRLRRFAGPPVRAKDLDVPLLRFVER